MPTARRRTRWSALAAVAVLAAGIALAGPAPAAGRPEFQSPFACGERWEGSTRASHSPSALSIDWNRDAYDEGHLVLASAPGTVTSVVDLGDTSYGLYVVIDHGGDWTSLHAHLLKALVVEGQRVDQGQPIALLGNSGGSSGAHLHYEQRLDRSDRHAEFNGKRFAYGAWLRSRNCTDVPVVGDWNGDRLSDVGSFGHQARSGVFRKRLPAGRRVATRLGLPTDSPVVGDWDGDGQSDVGVWRPASHRFVLSSPGRAPQAFSFGRAGDLPVSGDWDGDGRFEVGVFRPATRRFLLRDAGGYVTTRVLGSAASWPISGDWNGDGRFDVGVYNPAARRFTLARPDGSARTIHWGRRGALPAVGYYNGDARSDLGVWDPRTGLFVLRLSPRRSETIRFGHPR